MELIKNLLKYFVILLIIFVGAIALMCGIMFIFPNVKLFGFRYVANHKDNHVIYNEINLTKINIETNNYDVIVKPNSEENIQSNARFKLVIKNSYTGFSNNLDQTQIEIVSNNEEKEYINVADFNEANFAKFYNQGELTIKLIEPSGLVTYKNSSVEIYIPENLSGKNIEYNLKTNSGSIVFAKNAINPEQKLSTSDINISVNSARGSFNLDNAKMEDGSDLVISNYIGKVNINSNNIGNVVISSNSGNFTFKNIGYDGFNGGNLTVTGNNPYVKAETIYGNTNFTTTTGFLKVKEILGDTIITTQNGIVRIDKALGSIQSDNNSGETTINQIGEENGEQKSVSIISKSGAITLGGSLEETETIKGVFNLDKITTESSRVVVNNLKVENSEIETTKGSVLVNFDLSDNVKNLKVTTISGAITLNNIYGKIDAKTQNSSKITANFNKIALGEISNFETDNGVIEVKLPAPTNNTEKQYNLNLKTRKNSVSVNVGNFNLSSFETEKDIDGYYNFSKVFPTDASTTNTINLKTNSGKLIVKE